MKKTATIFAVFCMFFLEKTYVQVIPWASNAQITKYYEELSTDSLKGKAILMTSNVPFMGTQGMIIDMIRSSNQYVAYQPQEKEFAFICDSGVPDGLDPNKISRSLFYHDPKTDYWIRIRKGIIGSYTIERYVYESGEQYVLVKHPYINKKGKQDWTMEKIDLNK